ncbi:MAG TPA: hypothetical protein VF624_16485 [Tepidisphaeraceae bacterium]|jgi:hypothetical protein
MTAPPPVLPETYPAKPYKADGGFETPGLIMLATSMVVAGGVLGYLAHLINPHLWLVLLFPMILGAALGAVAKYTIKKGRVRSPLIAGVVAFVGAAFMLALMHHFDYERFLRQLRAEVPQWQELRAMTPAERLEAYPPPQPRIGNVVAYSDQLKYNELLHGFREIDVDSFGKYLSLKADDGIRLKSTRGSSDSSGAPITGIGVYIYWIVEILIAATIAFFMGRSQAKMPYSRRSGVWKMPQLLGSLDPAQKSDVVAALKNGNLARLQAAGPTAAIGPLMLTAFVSPTETEEDVDLKLESANPQGKLGQEAMVTLPAAALGELQAMFTPVPSVSDNASSAHPA